MFEEIATMDFPFEGIPTVPPRKDMDHMAFFCGSCRCGACLRPVLPHAARPARLLARRGVCALSCLLRCASC